MTPGITESQREPLQQRGPFWTPITPPEGSFFHADPHFTRWFAASTAVLAALAVVFETLPVLILPGCG
jgi:hypothetical protein